MRRLLLTITIALATATTALAQYNFTEPELYIGVHQGVAMWTQVFFVPSVEQNFDVRYHGGFTVRYIIQKYFGVQAELNYSQRGWSETSSSGEKYNHSLDYIEIPLISHIHFGNQTVRGFVNLGPKIRFLVRDQATAPFSTDPGAQQTMEVSNKFDYSVFAGAGIEYRTKKAGIFQLEARYDFGLGNIFPTGRSETFRGANNSAITLSVVYMYNVLGNKDKTTKQKNKTTNKH